MNLTVPGAVAALESAFLEMLGAGAADMAAFEEEAIGLARRCAAEAMGLALTEWDRGLRRSLPRGWRVHSVRARTLATMTGDVRFERAYCRDADGNYDFPLDAALDLPRGDRLSPAARSFAVSLGAEVPFARSAALMAAAGCSAVSPTAVMGAVRSAGERVAEADRRRARALYRDGVAPGGSEHADELLVEADGTYVRMRDGSTAEVKAVVAYAGKRARGKRVERVGAVRLGCVGEAPGDFWEQAVARVGAAYDLSRVGSFRLGTDGEAQYLAGEGKLPGGAEARIDPFHLDRAVASCFPAGSAFRSQAVATLWGQGAARCAGLIRLLSASGEAVTARAGEVADYLDAHASHIGGDGPSMGTMEAEQQHLYKSRMAGVPMAWSREGADAMARVRSAAYSGMEVPPRTRDGALSGRRRARREAAVARSRGSAAAYALQSEGKGWEYPVAGSLSGLRADVRFAGRWYADNRLL